eukprot:PITA_32670
MKNDVWEIVPRPEGKHVVTSKWICKIKHAANGNIDKYRARSMAGGFSQEEGEYYDETFAPVARYMTIRSLISIASSIRWNLHQMDAKTAFLNGVIEKEVYIEQRQGFEVHERKSHVCRLKKPCVEHLILQCKRGLASEFDTKDLGLMHYYLGLEGYTNSNWARSAEDRKSTSGGCFSVGSAMVSWMSKKQTSVTLSTVEAEYTVA